MIQILALQPTQRDPSRTMIRVGEEGRKGRVAATLSSKLMDELGLSVGQEWTDELAERVAGTAVYDKAFRAATRRLARRAMSRQEVDRKLRGLEFDAAVRERVLARLDELDLLDDAAYARMLVRDTLARRPAGPRLLQQKLMQKGIARDIIDAVIAENTGDQRDQTEAAVALAHKRLRSMARLAPDARRRRLYGVLMRRGFDSDTIKAAMEQVGEDVLE